MYIEASTRTQALTVELKVIGPAHELGTGKGISARGKVQ